ncbi:hypothetical protein E8E14_013586 [Neopestalotiopsis sp. 37M]|nr:hypothetical protein E8E14_013586 [Neopestalotiopsis sp. 37M]
MMLFRKKLEDPQESCGSKIPREITAPRVRRNVWWPRGVVKQVFVTEIRPELNIVLEHTVLGYADIFLSVFMIGSRPNTAVPTIMVSCLSKAVREEAVRAIKESDILQKHPEFSFGSSAVPLNEPAPSQSLASQEHQLSAVFQSPSTPKDDHGNGKLLDVEASMSKRVEYEILAADLQPSVGRRLFLVDSEGKLLRYATGGVTLRIGDRYYQRTIGHIDEEKEDSAFDDQSEDLDYCQLDEETDNEDEGVGHTSDHEITSRESLSPIPERLSLSGFFDAESDPDAVITDTPASDSNSTEFLSASSDSQHLAQDHRSDVYPSGVLHESPKLLQVGQLRYHSRDGDNAYLDYGLVLLDSYREVQSINEVKIAYGQADTSLLRIHAVARIEDVEKDVVVVTASNGPIRGKLIPGGLYLRSSTHPVLEELFVVYLQGQILYGDCGADVVDAQTGDLYGHIVRGCTGRQIAYIRAATDVFEDIQQRLGLVPVIAHDDKGEAAPTKLPKSKRDSSPVIGQKHSYQPVATYQEPVPKNSPTLGHGPGSFPIASREAAPVKDDLGPKIWTGTKFLPRFVRQAEVPGEGLCYFYDNGSHCKAVIDESDWLLLA